MPHGEMVIQRLGHRAHALGKGAVGKVRVRHNDFKEPGEKAHLLNRLPMLTQSLRRRSHVEVLIFPLHQVRETKFELVCEPRPLLNHPAFKAIGEGRHLPGGRV